MKAGKKQPQRRCANCFACFAETELCPLEPNYDEDKAFALLTSRLKEKKASNIKNRPEEQEGR